jgi:hypothetical protein
LGFLKSGGAKFPIDALRDAGVDVAITRPDRESNGSFPKEDRAIARAVGLLTIFWGPMAYAIMGGCLVVTVFTLIRSCNGLRSGETEH